MEVQMSREAWTKWDRGTIEKVAWATHNCRERHECTDARGRAQSGTSAESNAGEIAEDAGSDRAGIQSFNVTATNPRTPSFESHKPQPVL